MMKPSSSQARSGNGLAVAIVNYNTREQLKDCLDSVLKTAAREIVVVDNASTDGSADMVRQAYPQVLLEERAVNSGFGAGANRAIDLCRAAYVLLLNSDTVLPADTVEPLCRYMDRHPKVAIVGPRLRYPDGRLQTSCFHFPSPWFALLQAVSLGKLVGRIPGLKERYLPYSRHDRPRRVPWVLGAAMLIRKNAFEAVGGFDEAYFMYSEEVDLSYRLQQAGWQVHYAPVVEIVHVHGASTSKIAGKMEANRYLSTRRFYEKHYSRGQLAVWRLIITYSMLRNLVRDLLRLVFSKDSGQRAALRQNLQVWKQVLREGW
jgi:N-acetylglucosaminyl-diphospho-decaprenol L-rhamnosyltransferase